MTSRSEFTHFIFVFTDKLGFLWVIPKTQRRSITNGNGNFPFKIGSESREWFNKYEIAIIKYDIFSRYESRCSGVVRIGLDTDRSCQGNKFVLIGKYVL